MRQAPLIVNGEAGHAELLEVLEKVAEALDTANENADGDADDELFEAAMCRIRGCAVFVSRIHGYMRSTKRDAMTLRQEADMGNSSLYNKLIHNEFYRVLVAEYWNTIDNCDVCLPLLRKHVRLVSQVGKGIAYENSNQTLVDALNCRKDSKDKIRPSQGNDLAETISATVARMAVMVASDASSQQWIATQCEDLTSIFTRTADEIGPAEVLDLARNALSNLAADAQSRAAHTDLICAIQIVTKHVTETPFLDIDLKEIHKVRTDTIMKDSLDVHTGAYLVDAIKLFIVQLRVDAVADTRIVSTRFIKMFESLLFFCEKIVSELKKADVPELVADVMSLITLLVPLKALLGYVLLAPDAQGRVQKDATRSVAAAAMAGNTQLASLLSAVGPTMGLVKQFHAEFLADFAEAAEFQLRLLSTSVDEWTKSSQKVSVVQPFGGSDKPHWIDDCDAVQGPDDIDMTVPQEHCENTLFTADPGPLELTINATETAMESLKSTAETFGMPLPAAYDNCNVVFTTACVTKTETGILGTYAQLREKPMRLKRAIGEIYEKQTTEVKGRLHPTIIAVINAVAPSALKKAKVE